MASLHVDQLVGNDSNPGTLVAPLKTFALAWAKARAGDKIIVTVRKRESTLTLPKTG
jgi:hypothetical protein